MQSFARAVRQQPRQLVRPVTNSTARPFSQAQNLRLKEDTPQDPASIEKAKQEQLKGGKKSEQLESASESGINADQEKVSDHDEHIERLQQETARKTQKNHPDGK